jgi:glutamate-1-semialdehyde aminotransferase
MRHIYNGTNHSLPTIHEVECAERLKETFPWFDRVKFMKSGSDVCSAAIRFARAYTGRTRVLSEGYHGHHTEFVGLTPPALGVPDPGRNIEKLAEQTYLDDVAAIIVEPVILDYSRERINYLKHLRQVCDSHGIVLIFDEVITGLRWKKYSVSADVGVRPDLTCLGKAIGGGYSLAALGGKADILDNKQVFVSSTYAGETLPLIAGKRAIEIIREKSEYNIDYLWEKGQEFIDEFNALGGVQIEGYPTRGTFTGTIEERALFCQEMAKVKVLFHPSTWFFNFPLIKCMDDVLDLVRLAKDNIANNRVKLEYKLPQSPFAAKVRSQKC